MMPTSLIFSLAVFCGALLLFLVQPMVGKGVLPLFGGGSQVWVTCLLFFQSILLAGYSYAHLLARRVPARFQALLHLIVAAAGLLALPVAIPADTAPSPDNPPALELLALLARSIGLPALAVAATAPLVQLWFARTDHRAASDPYFLYAASNLGSLVALASYPTLIEPWFGLAVQGRVWTALYAALLVLLAICGAAARRQASLGADEPPTAAVAIGEKLVWLALSFAPSSLLLGVTSHITTDLVSAPALWIVPLSLYLATFVVAFARRAPVSRRLALHLQAVGIAALAVPLIAPWAVGFWPTLAAHLAAFTLSALACHVELAARRPAPAYLTEYYLWISIGGVLGGAFNALAAPLIFDNVFEYPLALLVVSALRLAMPATRGARSSANDLVIPALVAVNLWLAPLFARIVGVTLGYDVVLARHFVLGVLAALAALALIQAGGRGIRFALLAAAVIAFWQFPPDGGASRIVYGARSFYGVVRVEQDLARGMNLLLHGTTVHGAQAIDPAMRLEPITYYIRSGPFGDVFAALSPAQAARPVAVVGLGLGGLGCYGRAGAEWTFYEIDALVERVARDRRYFSLLADCPPNKRIVLGDARLSLRTAPDGAYGLIFMDAFNSDSVPTHLLTREAIALYLEKLAPDGLIAFNISHRTLDLAPVVVGLAADGGLALRIARFRRLESDEDRRYGYTVDVAIMARDERHFGRLANHPRWSIETMAPGRVWTDDYSSLLSLISRR